MAYAQTHAPEIGAAHFGLYVFQAIVATVAAAFFQAHMTRRDVELIVQHQQVRHGNFKEIGQSAHGLA